MKARRRSLRETSLGARTDLSGGTIILEAADMAVRAPVAQVANLLFRRLAVGWALRPTFLVKFCSGGRPACRRGRHPAVRIPGLDKRGNVEISAAARLSQLFPPGGTRRLYGRRDARRHADKPSFRTGGADFSVSLLMHE